MRVLAGKPAWELPPGGIAKKELQVGRPSRHDAVGKMPIVEGRQKHDNRRDLIPWGVYRTVFSSHTHTHTSR